MARRTIEFRNGEPALNVFVVRTVDRTDLFPVRLQPRFIVAGLLLFAAAMKSLGVRDSAATVAPGELPLLVQLLTAQCELVLVVLLVAGLSSRMTWFSAVVLFVVFGAFSFYHAVMGSESCGCFGPLKVNPWWTFGLDAAVLLLLWVKRNTFLHTASRPVCKPRLTLAAASYVVLAAGSLLLMVRPASASVADGVFATADGKVVVLTPGEWVGQELPIRNFVLPRTASADGDCIIVLYHHDCPKCQEALPKYERLASEFAQSGCNTQVVLMEVPPFGHAEIGKGAALWARLSADREWFVQAPVEIQLRGGKVTLASLELPSVADLP